MPSKLDDVGVGVSAAASKTTSGDLISLLPIPQVVFPRPQHLCCEQYNISGQSNAHTHTYKLVARKEHNSQQKKVQERSSWLRERKKEEEEAIVGEEMKGEKEGVKMEATS